MPDRIFVAVAWPYTNGPRHLGHVAGFGVPADIFARYHRLKGNDVLMVSGTDEHGTPNLIQADAEGLTPKEAVDKYNRIISDDLRALGLSYDCFTRTTTRNHTVVVQDVFKTLYEKGYLIKKTGARSRPRPGARFRIGTSRAPARSADSRAPAATSATTAATSSIPTSSSTRDRGSMGRRRSSRRRSTSISIYRRSRNRSRAGSRSNRTGGRTSATSRSTTSPT